MVNSNERHFTFYDSKTGEEFGRYKGKTPAQAASKAFTQMIKRKQDGGANINGSYTGNVTVRETTQGSDKKTYSYKATRSINKNANMEGGSEDSIQYKYKNTLTAI
jgi:hypothetical protein